MNPKGFVCSHLQVAETLGAFNYPKSECCNMTAPPAWFGIQSCVGCVYGTHKVCSTASSTMHIYICISARQGLLYPMHAVPCWSSPGYELVCLRGATQLWSQNHCNYVTLLLPLNCLAKLRTHLQGGLGWVASCSHITAVHQVVVQVCSQTALDLSASLSWSHFQASWLWLLASFICATARALLGLSTRTGCPRSAIGRSSVPGLRLTEQSETTGMDGAGNIPPVLDGAFPPPPGVLAAFCCHLAQWWTFKLEFRNHEGYKRHESLWWRIACCITGDYPVPTHIYNDNICLLV